jgi:hypothetical protein
MVINFQEISQATGAGKLCTVADWVESRMEQESERIAHRNDLKTRGDKIRLLADFPDIMPFWEDSFHLLECFTCKFLQEVNKNGSEPIKQMDWMTERIKKSNKTHIVAFCPACTSGDPWMVHNQSGYTLLYIDPGNKQVTFSQQRKPKTSEGWPKCPKKAPFYKASWWCLSELYDRPTDWGQQSDEYDKKMKIYEKEKTEYDTFCKKKLGKIQEIQEPTSKENKEELEEL